MSTWCDIYRYICISLYAWQNKNDNERLLAHLQYPSQLSQAHTDIVRTTGPITYSNLFCLSSFVFKFSSSVKWKCICRCSMPLSTRSHSMDGTQEFRMSCMWQDKVSSHILAHLISGRIFEALLTVPRPIRLASIDQRYWISNRAMWAENILQMLFNYSWTHCDLGCFLGVCLILTLSRARPDQKSDLPRGSMTGFVVFHRIEETFPQSSKQSTELSNKSLKMYFQFRRSFSEEKLWINVWIANCCKTRSISNFLRRRRRAEWDDTVSSATNKKLQNTYCHFVADAPQSIELKDFCGCPTMGIALRSALPTVLVVVLVQFSGISNLQPPASTVAGHAHL